MTLLEKRLIDVIKNTTIFDSYPVAIITTQEMNLNDLEKLHLLVKVLQSMDFNTLQINKDDMISITMFLSEKLWYLNQNNQTQNI